MVIFNEKAFLLGYFCLLEDYLSFFHLKISTTVDIYQ
jgi:hypothetical protein